MKKVVFIILILLSTILHSQQTLSVNKVVGDNAVCGGITSNTGKILKYSEIIGLPYYIEDFATAKVAYNYEAIPVRYNITQMRLNFRKTEKYLY